MENIVIESRLSDSWNLTIFPEFFSNEFLLTFSESLDVQWLEKVYGLFAQAIF